VELANQVFNGSPHVASQLALIQMTMSVVILVGVSRLGRTKAW
jgi:ABC-type Fe3+ transport system permease subunit